jgi:hypothetical protein
VRTWRRVAFLVLLAWVLFVATWATRSWTQSVPVTAPAGGTETERTFECSAPFRAKEVRPRDPLTGDEQLAQEPCEEHGERRVIAVLDIALGATVLVLLAYRRGRSGRHAEAAEAGLTG